MPNLCMNKMRIKGPKLSVDLFVERARGLGPSYEGKTSSRTHILNFHSLRPIPADLLLRTYGAEKERNENPNLERINGCLSGIEWERENWSCKWGALDTCYKRIDDETAYYEFETPYAPPFVLLKAIAAMGEFSDLEILLDFAGELMDFVGYLDVKNGKVSARCIDNPSDNNIREFLGVDGTPRGIPMTEVLALEVASERADADAMMAAWKRLAGHYAVESTDSSLSKN